MKSKTIFAGCDDGHAAIKLVWPNEKGELQYLTFPAKAIIGAKHSTVSGALRSAYSTEGRYFTVHDDPETVETRVPDYPTSDLNRVLVHHALHSAGLAGYDVFLATGLPPGFYYARNSSSGMNDALIDAKRESLTKLVRKSGVDLAPRIADHQVIPEAVAAVLDYLSDDEGNISEPLSGPVAVIDIGGRTTDCIVVVPSDDGSLTIEQTGQQTLEQGVMKVLDLVVSSAATEFSLEPREISERDTILMSKSIRIHGQSRDVSSHIQSALSEVIPKIQNFISASLGRGARFEKILFVGGGASLMQELTAAFPNSHIPDRPQYANARGMYKLLRSSYASQD